MTKSFLFVPMVLAAFSCGDSAGNKGVATTASPIGKACVPEDEAARGFFNFVLNEVAFSTDRTRCGVDAYCMAYHFEGRVTCPYGQTQEEIDTLPGDDPARCRMPDEQGNVTSEPLESPVDPQFVERRAEDVVYCTCQCEGGDSNVDYCTCPAGFECASTVDIPGLLGKYCIRSGFDYDPVMPPQGVCEKTGTDAATDCGNGRQNP